MEIEYRDRGIDAYQKRDFAAAVELLSATAQNQWDARLYLGMSLYMLGRHKDAREEFRRLKDDCPDNEIRMKATSAFVAVNSKMLEADRAAEREEEEVEEEVEW